MADDCAAGLQMALSLLDNGLRGTYVALRDAGLSVDAAMEAVRTHAADAVLQVQRERGEVDAEVDGP